MTKPPPLVILALALLAPWSAASATANEWAVVPAARGDVPALMENVVLEIGRELERQGRRVWTSETATALFERKVSAEPIAMSDETLARWLDDSRSGLRKLALGEHDAALALLRRATQTSRSALTSLNRDEERAQRVLDTCLYLVRALLEVGKPADARRRVQECVLLTPGGKPQDLMHPPSVLALYEEAHRKDAEGAGKLIVDSDRKGCAVRVNGMRLGRTPFETGNLRTGIYAVQVECGDEYRGRIHSAAIGTSATRLFVDEHVDAIVRTEPMLRLEHVGQQGVTSRKAAARGIARALPARWVILVSQPSRDTIELDLVGDSDSRMGCARVEVGPRGVRSDALALAVRNVIAGECRDASALGAPAASEPGPQSLFIPGI